MDCDLISKDNSLFKYSPLEADLRNVNAFRGILTRSFTSIVFDKSKNQLYFGGRLTTMEQKSLNQILPGRFEAVDHDHTQAKLKLLSNQGLIIQRLRNNADLEQFITLPPAPTQHKTLRLKPPSPK